MEKRILIINPFGIGDVLFSTALISVIRKDFPKRYIGYICNKKTREVLETNPAIDEIFVFERDEYRALWRKSKAGCIKQFLVFWQNIRQRKFDLSIDLSLGKEYAFFCWFAGIKERRGFDYKGRGRFLTRKVAFDGFNDKPVAEYYLTLLDMPGTEKFKTTLVPTDQDRSYIETFLNEAGVKQQDTLIGIAPGGGVSFGEKDQSRRRWPVEKFSKLADKIVEKFHARIVLIWGPGEKELAHEIKNLMRQPAIIAPETSVRQMAALCGKCGLVICSEGGPLHIASSQGVKTVSIFGPVDEKVYGPYPPSEDNIVITSNAECRPCYKRFKLPECDIKKCMESITAETVFNAMLHLR